MNLQLVFIFLLFLTLLNVSSIFAENMISEKENLSSIENFRSPTNSKIHPTLIQWKISDDPNEFAKQNNLSYIDNKIGVYIYLESAESRIKIPQDITITGSDQKIIVGFVSIKQLDMLEKLDFVERVTLPDLARTSILKEEISESPPIEENHNNYLLWPVIGVIIFMTIVIFIKRRNSKDWN
jgi:hypothetical protein